jgi:cytochrome c553
VRVRLRHLGYLLAAAVLAGATVFWFGWISISASSGHWAVTSWVLHTAMERAVKSRSAHIEPPPDLVDAARVRRGAGHFETGCAPCHGSPARPRGAVADAMTPYPPVLPGRISEWEPRQLFWIVKHGVKYTGMPAWPAQSRDDEVWAVTAFLLSLPGMSAEAYLRLAYGEGGPETSAPGGLSLAAEPALADCARCHGTEGLGPANGAFPRLDIQTEEYLLAALRAFRSGARESGIMQAAVSTLDEDALVALAEHYARPKPLAPAPLARREIAADLLARGELIAEEGLPAEDIGACLGCHGSERRLGRPEFPRLDGQYPGYLALQLVLFATASERGGGRFANLMLVASHQLDPADIEAVALYFASRPPGGAGE